MKYCYECGRMTPGEPIFCNFCGRSYDVKLCPRLHPNSRIAEVCSQCGSRDLSTPQPKVSLWWRFVGWLVRVLVGMLLGCLSILLLLTALLRPGVQNALLALGIVLAVLWWFWSQLPDWFRKLVRKSFERKRRSHDR
jgi:RNA polymerase subunit RPABC4/transcription elongation factor Spt4